MQIGSGRRRWGMSDRISSLGLKSRRAKNKEMNLWWLPFVFALAGLDAVGGVVEHGLISGDDVIVQALVELIHNMTPDVIMVKKKKHYWEISKQLSLVISFRTIMINNTSLLAKLITDTLRYYIKCGLKVYTLSALWVKN